MKIIDSHAHIGKIGCYSSDAAMLQKTMDSFNVQTAIISNMSANEFDCDGNDMPVLFAWNDIENLFWKNSERLFNLEGGKYE